MCDQWNGRIFSRNGACGDKGEECTMTEFNLDTGNNFTPQESPTLHLSIPGSLTSFSGLWYIKYTGKYTIMSKHPHTINPWSSDLQGFTQSIGIAVNGCDTVACTNVNCGCSSAYPPGVSVIGFAHAWFVPTCGCTGSFGMWQWFTSPRMLCWRSLVDHYLLSLSLSDVLGPRNPPYFVVMPCEVDLLIKGEYVLQIVSSFDCI